MPVVFQCPERMFSEGLTRAGFLWFQPDTPFHILQIMEFVDLRRDSGENHAGGILLGVELLRLDQPPHDGPLIIGIEN